MKITDLGFTQFNTLPSPLDEQDDNPDQTFPDDSIPGSQLAEVAFDKIVTGTLQVGQSMQSGDYVALTSGWKIWVDADGVGYIEAQNIIAGNYIQVFRQDAIPTSIHIGDLWVDTDAGNKLYVALSIGATTIAVGKWVDASDEAIATAQAAADAAQADADTAQGELDEITSDSSITPVEKLTIKPLWNAIVAEKTDIDTEADSFSVSKTAYTTAYDALDLYLNTTLDNPDGVFDDMTSTTTIVRADWDAVWEAYYNAKIEILNAISSAAKALADTAQSDADTAQAAAEAAQADADTNDALLDDIAADTEISPVEKLIAKPIWDDIVVEGTADSGTIPVQATAFSVNDDDFDTAYASLDAYLNTDPDIFDNLAISTTITRSEWNTAWDDYWNARTVLLNAIATAAKDLADTAQGAAEAAQADATTAISDAATAQGELDDIAADTKITPVEKLTAKPIWDAVVTEKSDIDTQSDTYSVSKVAYGAAYDALNLYLNTTTTVFANMTTTTTIVRADWDAVWEAYYNAKIEILQAIADATALLANWSGLTGTTPSFSDNLIYNPSFDAGILGWDKISGGTFEVITSSSSINGSKVLQCGAAIYFEAEEENMIPVEEGKTYYGEIWYKQTVDSSGDNSFYAGVRRRDYNKANPSNAYFMASGVTPTVADGWVKYTGTIVAGAGYKYFSPMCLVNYQESDGAGHIAYFKLTEVTWDNLSGTNKPDDNADVTGDNNNWSEVADDDGKLPQDYADVTYGGDGSDGALNVTSGTTTLSVDVIYNYSSINVSAGATLRFTQGGNGGGYINCKGNCTIAGTLDLRGVISGQVTLYRGSVFEDAATGNGTPTFRSNKGGVGGVGGTSTAAIGTDGGAGGDSDVAGDGSGGAGGYVPSTKGGDGGGGNSAHGAGGGGGGGAYTDVVGDAGSAYSGNNGGDGGDGAHGNKIGGCPGASSCGGGGGGGGAGWNTGNGGNGGNGADSQCSHQGGKGGDGGDSGANGGNGGNGGNNAFHANWNESNPAGAGGDGYLNGGAGGFAANSCSLAGNGGIGKYGDGGAGGSASDGSGGDGGNGYNGGNGGTGSNGDGGNGGNGSGSAASLILHITGSLNLTGDIYGQGGNGGNGGGGSGDNGNGGDGGDGSDVYIKYVTLIAGSLSNIDVDGGTGGGGTIPGTAGANGTKSLSQIKLM